MRRRDLFILGAVFIAIAYGILRFLPDAIDSTFTVLFGI